MSDWKNFLTWGKMGLQYLTSGQFGPLRLSHSGALVVSQGGKYADAALAGRVFNVANQAAIATTAALATTWTGLCVGNPVGSGVNVRLIAFGFPLTLAGPAAGAIGIMTGTQTTTASLTPRNALIGGPASKVYANAGQTIGTPVLDRVVGSYGTAATTAFQVMPAYIDLDGAIVVTPGTFAATYTTTACTAAFIFSFTWEEVPI